MHSVETLIDKASDLCGSDAALARRLGITRGDIAHFRKGRPMSVETIAMLCDVVGVDQDDSRRMALEAVINNPKNAGRAEVLRRVFFASSTALLALCAGLASPDAKAAGVSPETHLAVLQSIHRRASQDREKGPHPVEQDAAREPGDASLRQFPQPSVLMRSYAALACTRPKP